MTRLPGDAVNATPATPAEVAAAVRACAPFADPRSARRCEEAADMIEQLDAEVKRLHNRLVNINGRYANLMFADVLNQLGDR